MSTRHTAYVRLRLVAFELEIKMEKEKRMKRKVSPKHFLTMLLLCILLAVSFQVPSLAACSHSSLGSQYSEAAHPHAYYKTCNSCGQKIYSGGYATKTHGDGSWGSGTCPDCGTHTYGNTYSELHILIIITKRVYAVMSNIPVGTLQKHMAMEVGGVGHARIAGRIHMLGKPALRPELVHVVQ